MSPRSAVLDLIEQAESQGYRTHDKGGGTWMVHAPAGRAVNPQYQTVAIHLPRSDSGNALQTIKANLKRAGVKFPDDLARERTRSVQTKGPEMTSATAQTTVVSKPTTIEADPIDALLSKLNQLAELAADAAGLVEKIRKQASDKAKRADEVLAAFDLLAKAREGR
jgi:hypothetical protein